MIFLNKFKIGSVVLLPDSKYPNVVGTVIAINRNGNLVQFNGTQQLYFSDNELSAYNRN